MKKLLIAATIAGTLLMSGCAGLQASIYDSLYSNSPTHQAEKAYMAHEQQQIGNHTDTPDYAHMTQEQMNTEMEATRRKIEIEEQQLGEAQFDSDVNTAVQKAYIRSGLCCNQ